MNTYSLIALCFILVSIICYALANILREKNIEKINRQISSRSKNGIVTAEERKNAIDRIGNILPKKEIQNIFDRSKNPWGISVELFQSIRIIGLVIGIILLPIFISLWGLPYGALPGAIVGGLAWFYPTYYYKSIGNEREEEFNKVYEFIWVLKNNMSLYAPKQTLLNVKEYLEVNAPQNEHMIEFFNDFYERWDDTTIDPYMDQYYPFSIPKEIISVVFSSNATGTNADSQLDQLRVFTINAQDKSVINILSKVPSSATIFSLPFMMISVMIAMLIPMIVQFMQMM